MKADEVRKIEIKRFADIAAAYNRFLNTKTGGDELLFLAAEEKYEKEFEVIHEEANKALELGGLKP